MPNRRGLRGVVVCALAASSVLLGRPAGAQSKDATALKVACVQASDKAQQLRVAGKLVSARDTLRTCVQDACPSVVREACSQWLGEVNASLPSIVIGAKDGDGKDLLDLKVSIDGQLVTEPLGGRALQIDPGRHKMRYEKADGTVLEEDILVGEGAKNRAVSVQFPGAAGKAAVAGLGPAAPAGPAPSTSKGASTANTVVGTVFAVAGAASLGTALYLDLSTTSDVNADKATGGCAGPGSKAPCSASTVSGYQLDYDLAGVALGVGIVAIGFATYVFIGHPFGTTVTDAGHAKTDLKPAFRFVPSPHGGAFALTF